jgi:4-nitrophenyl phosphatase
MDKGPLEESDLHSIVPDDKVGAVVGGFDIHINYRKIAKAFTYLQNPQCLFIAANADCTYPMSHNVLPGR